MASGLIHSKTLCNLWKVPFIKMATGRVWGHHGHSRCTGSMFWTLVCFFLREVPVRSGLLFKNEILEAQRGKEELGFQTRCVSFFPLFREHLDQQGALLTLYTDVRVGLLMSLKLSLLEAAPELVDRVTAPEPPLLLWQEFYILVGYGGATF